MIVNISLQVIQHPQTLSIVVRTCNPSTLETKAEGLQVEGYLVLYRNFRSLWDIKYLFVV